MLLVSRKIWQDEVNWLNESHLLTGQTNTPFKQKYSFSLFQTMDEDSRNNLCRKDSTLLKICLEDRDEN